MPPWYVQKNKNRIFNHMKLRLILLFSCIAFSIVGQTDSITNALQEKLSAHFMQYMPESQRYSDITSFGEKKTNFDKEQIDKELHLFEEVKKSGLIKEPTSEVFDLCHNILIHSRDKGETFLTLLSHPISNKELLMPFFMEIVFTGEFGERLMLQNLTSDNLEWKRDCAGYLGAFAIYESSIPMIEKTLQVSKDPEIQQDLIGALTFISNTKSIRTMQQLIETTKEDETQARAIFAYTELTGFNGINYLEQVKPIGEKSEDEKKVSLEWLKKETSAQNKYGVNVNNDLNFILRFGDIKAPSTNWMKKEGLLDTIKASHPVALDRPKKAELMNVLIESKGFGLEAVKANLFLSLDQMDIPDLLTLRQSCVYSPNSFSFARLQTIGFCIRYLRKTKK